MCFPNDSDELRHILRDMDYIDQCIELLKPRSPRVSEVQNLAPSLPVAGAGNVDSRPYQIGSQPCDDFLAERERNGFGEWDNVHDCYGGHRIGVCCDGKVSFCVHCHFDHHTHGWENCAGAEPMRDFDRDSQSTGV